MKTASQETGMSRAEEKLKSYESYKNVDLPCSVGITLVQDIPLPSDPKGPVKKEVDPDGEEPARILAWLAEARKHFAPKFGAVSVKELEGMLDLYLTKVSSCISRCYVPNRAAKMKRCIGDILLFFNVHYRELPEMEKTYSTYLDKMTELIAYYIDMEIQASSRAKEAPQAIASRLTLSLYTFLDKSHDHILDSILKANNMNKNFWELCSLLFSGVLKDSPNRILSDLTYVRYVLVYKMWKRVVQGPEERKKVMTLASLRLRHPPQFVERTRAGFLNGIIPKIPKKRTDVTMFLIQAKFDVKEKAKAFLKYLVDSKTNVMFVPTVPAIKTDIPLLVGHLPDFGPSPNLVKLEPPEIEDDDDPQKVDISGSRLMNEIWTSVNHEASFREAIRMQNVTTFSRSQTKLADRKKMLRALKLRKGRAKNSVVSKNISEVSKEKGWHDVPENPFDAVSCTTIVVSDDSEKGSDVEKEVGGPVHVENVKKKSAKPIEQKESSTKKPDSKVSKKDPTPVIESPKTPELSSQNVILLDPSQIKLETRDDAVVDDEVVMDLPLPQKSDESVAKEVSVESCATKEEIEPSSLSGQFDEKTIEVSDDLCEFKEERQSPAKETEAEIRLNSDLLDHIKFAGRFHIGSSDTAVKPSETPSLEIEKETDVDSGSKSVSSPEKRRREDSVFDDDSSWSPSGGSQEFIRSVVSNFISTYSPDEEADNRIESSAPPKNVENQVVDDDFDLDELGYGEKQTFEPAVGSEDPPAKRSRIEVERPVEDPVGPTTETTTPAKSGVQVPQSNESVPSSAGENQDPATYTKYSLHNITLRYHHNCYMEQAQFRDLCTSFMVKPEDEVPSAYFKDPVTGRLSQGCGCEQCAANFTALCSNVKCLVEFKRQTLLAMGNESAPVASTTREDLNEFEGKPVENPDQDEHIDEFAAGGEASVQLPFKKRKAFSGRDDGESQHSDASKEEETRQWPVDDYPSHTPTRMFSIATLEDVSALNQASPTLSGSCMFENVSMPSASTSAATNPEKFRFGQDYLQTAQSTGGGFPPFSSVVPPETRPQPYYDMGETPVQDQQCSHHSANDTDFTRRHFRTPAELKATFHAGPATSRSVQPWTQDLVNVAYFTRNLTSTSSNLAPEAKRSSKKDPSRKSSKSSRKRK